MSTTEAKAPPRREATPAAGTPGAIGQGRLRPQGVGYGLKRTVLGPAIPTHRSIHERLGKITALSIFSSDALSSVAYATEEMMRAMYFVVGVAMFSFVFPISLAIAIILATLVFSYRQTIKAYPSAGGAYIVTKDNFGLLPAQVAGVALLTDYVLTVAVSISAGVAAIVTAANDLYPYRVPMALLFLGILMWGNLRGVRESGKMFAAPTYLFILGIFALLVVAYYRITAGGGIAPLPTTDLPPAPGGTGLLAGVSLFIILKALASGTTAVTGVEAISNGVPAFKPPEWRNARATLMTMGAILGTMFLGISFLVAKLHVAPDLTDRNTVLGMLAQHVFGSSSFGHAAFLYIQITTMAILVLAANTSFADFPRLANFHAGDSFMPRQFTSRGHRLVFSNGIIALGVAAGFLIVLFQANVTKLIPFYALGVFTSFTMSQAGMAKRHLRLKEPGWRHGFAINAFGAVMTGVVDLVIMVTKFPDDTAIIVLVPILVVLLVRMNRAYEHERELLDEDLPRFDATEIDRPTLLLVVEDLDRQTIHALQYAKTIRPRDVHAVHFVHTDADTSDLAGRWKGLAIDVPLELVTHREDLPEALAWYVGALPAEADVNVVLANPAEMPFLRRLRRRRFTTQIAHALLPYERVRVTVVRDHMGPGHTLVDTDDGSRIRFAPRSSHRVVVLIEKADRATLRAVRYAMSLGGTDVWAVHAAIDLDNQERLIRDWMDLAVPVQLDVIECWDRNVARALEAYVVELMGKQHEVTVVLARRDYPHALQRLLHDRTSRKIMSALGRYEHVDVTVVPYFLGIVADGGSVQDSTEAPGGPFPPGASVASRDADAAATASGRPPALS